MTSAYTGIEQVCVEIHNQEERKSIMYEREQIANLAIIYMHYNIGPCGKESNYLHYYNISSKKYYSVACLAITSEI
jgi:hypothetical protein